MTIALILVWLWAAFLFLELTAVQKDVYPVGVCAAPVKRWSWPFPVYFIVLTFVAWPLVVPFGILISRRKQSKG